MIAFTVMDHDVLTANDFAGEAFLALGSIPGVADYNATVDNFHGLKQVDLPLMQQHDKRKKIIFAFNFLNFPNLAIPSKLQIIRFYKYWNPEWVTKMQLTLYESKRLD